MSSVDMSTKLYGGRKCRIAVVAAPFPPIKPMLVFIPLKPAAKQLIRIAAVFESAHVRLQLSENVLSAPKSFSIDHDATEERNNRIADLLPAS